MHRARGTLAALLPLVQALHDQVLAWREMVIPDLSIEVRSLA